MLHIAVCDDEKYRSDKIKRSREKCFLIIRKNLRRSELPILIRLISTELVAERAGISRAILWAEEFGNSKTGIKEVGIRWIT